MRVRLLNHCSGSGAIPKSIQAEVARSIETAPIIPSRGASAKLRNAIITNLITAGWSGEMRIASTSEMTITSVKSGVGLCLQTGNTARMYADLIKLQKMYLDGAIMAAVLILPSQACAQKLGDNVAHADRLERELEIFGKVIYIPMVIFSIE